MSDNTQRCILYHGSAFRIERPVFGVGKAHNDYGLGFYCAESCEMAMEWAVGEDHDGYANRYELDLSGLLPMRNFAAPSALAGLACRRCSSRRPRLIAFGRAAANVRFGRSA